MPSLPIDVPGALLAGFTTSTIGSAEQHGQPGLLFGKGRFPGRTDGSLRTGDVPVPPVDLGVVAARGRVDLAHFRMLLVILAVRPLLAETAVAVGAGATVASWPVLGQALAVYKASGDAD